MPLHHRRDGNSHHGQRADQFAADYRYRRQQKLFSLLVGLVLLVGGFVYFRRVERYFADLI